MMSATARRHTSDDIGNKHAEPGTRDWSSYIRLQIQGERHDLSRTIQQCKTWLEMFRRYEGWRLLQDNNGQPFLSFLDFCQYQEPEGLGTPYAIIEAILAEDDTTKTLGQIQLLARGRPKKGEGKDEGPHLKPRTVAYYLARLERDDHELAARVKAGELTANAAARIKGWHNATFRIPADVEGAAAALKRRFPDPEDREQLANLLMED